MMKCNTMKYHVNRRTICRELLFVFHCKKECNAPGCFSHTFFDTTIVSAFSLHHPPLLKEKAKKNHPHAQESHLSAKGIACKHPFASPKAITDMPNSSKIRIKCKSPRLFTTCLRHRRHDTRLLVFADTFLKEICFALKGNQFHPIERIACPIKFGVTQCSKQAVRHKFNVPCHQLVVHANEITRKSFRDEKALHPHCTADDVMHNVFWELMLEFPVKDASKFRMQAFIT